MKRIHPLFFVIGIVAAFLSACSPSEHDDREYYGSYVNLKPTPQVNQDSDPTIDPDPNMEPHKKFGHRVPGGSVRIFISSNTGVSIPGVDSEDIFSYSIYSEDGMLVAMYADDIDFAQAVFAMTGVFEIRIALDGYSLCGWMEN